MEFSNSGANLAVSHAQITRRCLGPIETCNSGANHAAMNAQTRQVKSGTHRDYVILVHNAAVVSATKPQSESLGPIVTCNSGAKGAVLNAKIHR